MRKTETLEIEGYKKRFTVNELTVKEIISLMDDDTFKETSLESFKKGLDEKILPLCTNVKVDDLIAMAPSEIMEIWEAFRKVNASFFEVAQKMGLTELLNKGGEELKKAILGDFSKLAVASLKQDTPTS